MKKACILFIIIITITISSCSNKKESKENEQVKLEQEIKVIDSISSEVEALKNDIKDSSKKLDELLNDL